MRVITAAFVSLTVLLGLFVWFGRAHPGDRRDIIRDSRQGRQYIERIQKAERKRKEQTGAYADLKTLWGTSFDAVERGIAKGLYDGFHFEVFARSTTYVAIIVPATDSRRISFFSDETENTQPFVRALR